MSNNIDALIQFIAETADEDAEDEDFSQTAIGALITNGARVALAAQTYDRVIAVKVTDEAFRDGFRMCLGLVLGLQPGPECDAEIKRLADALADAGLCEVSVEEKK